MTQATERFPTLRQSRLATADRCLLQSRYTEELESGWSTHAQARGTIFHRVAAKLLWVMHEQQERSVPTDLAVTVLEETLRQADVPASELINIPLSEVADLRWMVIKFAHDLTDWDIDNLVAIEEQLEAAVTYPGPNGPVERVVTGRPDALFVTGEQDEEIVLLDYKSGWSMPAPSDLDWDGTFQLRSYGWLVLRNYPAVERVTLREVYVRYSQFRESSVYRYELENMERELAALAERFDRAWTEEVFPPSPGVHCQTCPNPTACPIFPDVRVQGMITDDVTALRVAGEAVVAKAALKQREDALRARAAVHGPVTINSTPGRERVWGFREAKRTARPTRDELEKALYLYGKRVDLDTLYRESTHTRFDAHPPEPHETPDLGALLEESLRRHSA